MNNKTHFILFIIFSCAILYIICRKSWIKEPFGNQIIIHPDGSFDPQETTFSVLTYDSDLSSGYTQVATCSDDNSWTNGNKTCRDYSLVGSSCDDIGSDGRSALEGCKVACDNCDTYTDIIRRIPSPVEDTEEPSYSRFQGQGEGSGDFGGDFDGVGSREMIDKLGEMTEKLSAFEMAFGAQGQRITELTSQLSMDCEGEWSQCEVVVGDEGGEGEGVCNDKTYSVINPARHGGNSCPNKDGDKESCASVNGCNDNQNCVGSWSDCTNECDRVWNGTRSQGGVGAVCQEPENCENGEGDCRKVDCIETGNSVNDCDANCEVPDYLVATPVKGVGMACIGEITCGDGDGDCRKVDCIVTGNSVDDCDAKCEVPYLTSTPANGFTIEDNCPEEITCGVDDGLCEDPDVVIENAAGRATPAVVVHGQGQNGGANPDASTLENNTMCTSNINPLHDFDCVAHGLVYKDDKATISSPANGEDTARLGQCCMDPSKNPSSQMIRLANLLAILIAFIITVVFGFFGVEVTKTRSARVILFMVWFVLAVAAVIAWFAVPGVSEWFRWSV